MILVIIILAKSFKHMKAGGKACAILYLVPSPLNFINPLKVRLLDCCLTLIIVVAFALAQRIPSGLSRIKIAFVVLALLGIFSKAIVMSIVSIVESKLYEEWISSYIVKTENESNERFRTPWNSWVAKHAPSMDSY